MAKVDTNVRELIINRLTNEQYKEALAAGEINDNELYMTPAEEAADATQESHGYMSVADKVKLDKFEDAAQYVQKDEINSLVGAVKNPFALNIEAGGQIAAKYDGSEDVTLTIDKALVGLELVDNTPDSEKRVAYADEAIIADKANIATKLDANSGSTTRPVYFEDGEPKMVDYELGTAATHDESDFAESVHNHNEATTDQPGFMAPQDKENLDSLYQKFGRYSITVSQVDLTAGSSYLPTGCIYIVYE